MQCEETYEVLERAGRNLEVLVGVTPSTEAALFVIVHVDRGVLEVASILRPVPVGQSTLETALLLQRALKRVDVPAVPGQEEALGVHGRTDVHVHEDDVVVEATGLVALGQALWVERRFEVGVVR